MDCYPTNISDYAIQEYYSKCDSPEANNVAYYFFRVYKRETLLWFLRKALRSLGERGSTRILDLGCGDATDLDYCICRMTNDWRNMAAVSNFRWSGIDGYEMHVRLAQERYRRLGLDSEFVCGAITGRLPWPNEAFDVILCSEVVEHLQQPQRLLRECFRLLKPGGFLILTTDNEPTAFAIVKRAAFKLLGRYRKSESELWRHERHCSPKLIAEIDGVDVPIYGHIHTCPTRAWERMCRETGFKIASYGRYRSVIRRLRDNSPVRLFALFSANHLVSLLPPVLGRLFDATTALLLRKPEAGSVPRPQGPAGEDEAESLTGGRERCHSAAHS